MTDQPNESITRLPDITIDGHRVKRAVAHIDTLISDASSSEVDQEYLLGYAHGWRAALKALDLIKE